MYAAVIFGYDLYATAKLVLIAPAPDPHQVHRYVVFHCCNNQDQTPSDWLGETDYMITPGSFVGSFLLPDGMAMSQRWGLLSSLRFMGRVEWNTEDGIFRASLLRQYSPILSYFFGYLETSDDTTEAQLLPSTEAAPSMEEEPDLSDFVSQNSAATEEHDMAHLLPADPFGMMMA